MIKLLKKIFPFFFLVKDPIFSSRKIADAEFFNGWLLVELGADQNVILTDMYHQIVTSDKGDKVKINQIIGLRYQALAMSLRTPILHRIPLNWQDPAHILWLSTLPSSVVVPALDAIADLSKMPIIGPTVSQQSIVENDVNDTDSSAPEEHNANPS